MGRTAKMSAFPPRGSRYVVRTQPPFVSMRFAIGPSSSVISILQVDGSNPTVFGFRFRCGGLLALLVFAFASPAICALFSHLPSGEKFWSRLRERKKSSRRPASRPSPNVLLELHRNSLQREPNDVLDVSQYGRPVFALITPFGPRCEPVPARNFT